MGAAVVALGAAFHSQAAAQSPPFAWVQHVGDGAAEVRALVSGDRCPNVRIDGAPETMTLRVGPEPKFPTRVCSLRAPAGARWAEVEGTRLKLPRREVRRILILGDTGCRLKGATVQACNDPRLWPFATVARLAAARRPDLIIHVGDYFYRETACPAREEGCAGSPYGDAQPSWDADFFEPVRPLLEAAPWVFVRGNHEDCDRGARGWFRMLDAGPEPLICPTVAAPFTVRLKGLALQVVDGAYADDRNATSGQVATFRAQVDQAPPAPAPRWLLTHRPVWALVPALKLGPLGTVEVGINATEQQALRGRPLEGVDMIVSGHIHHLAAYDFGGDRPSQLVVGTGGDVREKADSARVRSGRVTVDGLEADRFTFARYGYLLLERAGAGWIGRFHDVNDRVAATCRIEGRSLSCRSPAKR